MSHVDVQGVGPEANRVGTRVERGGSRTRSLARLWARRDRVLLHAALIVITFVCLLPIYWGFAISFMGKEQLYRATPSLIPQQLTLDNYFWVIGSMQMGAGNRFPTYFTNSVIVTTTTVALVVFTSSMAGYAFGRLQFRGRDAIFYAVVLSLFIPRVGGLMALYEVMNFLGLRNNLLGLSLLFAGGLSVPVFIMRQAYLHIPSEFEDAARVDGANRWQVFARIMLPMASGAMMVVGIFTFIQVWGEYLVTLTMMDAPTLYTLGVGIAGLYTGGAQVTVQEVTTYGAQAAGYMLYAAPVAIVFLAMQKWFVQGISEGIKF